MTTEDRVIYNTVAKVAMAQHEKAQQDLKDFINSAMDVAMTQIVNTTERTCVPKAQSNMQVYTEGVESLLQQSLDSIRVHVGFAASVEPDHHRTSANDAETGRRCDLTTRRQGVGASGFYTLPPAQSPT